MNTRTMRGMIVATAVLALTIGACKKKPKEDKAKKTDMAADVMKPASMDAMKPATDAMKPAGMDAMKPATDAMKPAGMDAARPVAKAGDGFVIKFDRPLKVGQKYAVSIRGQSDTKTTLNGKALPQQTVKATYIYGAIHTVKAVDKKGDPTKEEIKIIKLTMTKGGATKDVLAKNTIVLAEAEGNKEKFSVGGKPVDPQAAKLLKEMVDLADDDPSTDDVFGPGGPKKPGDSWNVNMAKLLEGLKNKFKKPGLWPKAGDANGKVTFVGVKKLMGVAALEIKIQTKIKNIAPGMGPVKATAGSMEITMSGLMPKDPKITATGMRKMTMKMHVEGEMKKGAKTFKLVVDVVQSQVRSDKLIK